MKLLDAIFGKAKAPQPAPARKASPRPAAPKSAGERMVQRASAPPKPAAPASKPAEQVDLVPSKGIGMPPATRPETAPAPVATAPVGDTRVRIRDAVEEDVNDLDRFSGQVLTAESGGTINIPSNARRFLAALDDGTLIVAKSEQHSSAVTNAQNQLSRSGFRPKIVLLVDISAIRRVYDNHTRRIGGVGPTVDSAQMQRMVVELIRAAAEGRCSDIHITVRRYEAEIRVRSDGVMTKLRDLLSTVASDLCQAAFNMADASDSTYKPLEYQGARITSLKTENLPPSVQAVRLQFNPLPDGGRYCIMRLLYAQKVDSKDDVDRLGYSAHQIGQIKRMRRKPSGINVISGPTGSGKSTTLQRSIGAGLYECKFEKNVVTVEDPPEYEISGAAQLPVTNVKTEEERREAFRQAITASLRSDPDIVMIGEIRDGASANLAFQASMTGHQVWASLHANDAFGILDRLHDMGVELYRLSDYTLVTGLIGQRLVRTLCPHCRLTYREGVRRRFLAEDVAAAVERLAGPAIDGVHFANPDGCKECRGGYSGRSVVAEVILPDQKFMEFVAERRKIEARKYWLDSLKGVTMVEHAMTKVMAGLVDPREVEDKVGLIDEIDFDRFPSILDQHVKMVEG